MIYQILIVFLEKFANSLYNKNYTSNKNFRKQKSTIKKHNFMNS